MSEKCEFCGRFGAHKLKIPSRHPQAVNGLETAYLCNRCANRASLESALSNTQRSLARKHGTPAEFAAACFKACPEFVSMDEAQAAVNKYNKDWTEAA